MNKIKLFGFADEASQNLDKQIDAMKRNGLDGLEIRFVDNVNVSDFTVEKAKEVRKKLDDAGLVTWSIGSPIGKIDIVKDDFSAHLDKFKNTLEVANILGAKKMRIFSFFIPKDDDPSQYKNEVIDRLGKMAEINKNSGVVLCHENEKGIYGDIAPRCLEILKAIPEIKGVFDPANFIQCGQETLSAWDMLFEYIDYFHIKDVTAGGDVVPAGMGVGNIPEIAEKYLKNGGYAFTVEPHLTVFSGLDNLEREGEKTKVGKISFPDNDTAFDAACNAIKNILQEA